MNTTGDLRDEIFSDVMDKRVTAVLVVQDNGVIFGTKNAEKKAKELGLEVKEVVKDGSKVKKGDIIMRLYGNPKQIALAEDVLIGMIAKPSGIATAAYRAKKLAAGRFDIVSGAWKKMPLAIKDMIREALTVGGVGVRIVSEPFVYLDKNYVRIFGGVREALLAVKRIGRKKVIQLKGETNNITQEAVDAVEAGADVIVVDTGKLKDVQSVIDKLNELGYRSKVKIAFAGGVKLTDIKKIQKIDLDILEIGRAIIDAPLLDVKLDVIKVESKGEK